MTQPVASLLHTLSRSRIIPQMSKIISSGEFRLNKTKLIDSLREPGIVPEIRTSLLEDQDFLVANENNWRRSYFVVNIETWVNVLALAGFFEASENREGLIKTIKDAVSERFSNLVKRKYRNGKA